MFHKITAVTPMADYILLATFQDGSIRQYDVKPLPTRWAAFSTLWEIPGLFERVQVDAGGYGVSWNDALDLSCDEIWENGTPIQSKTA